MKIIMRKNVVRVGERMIPEGREGGNARVNIQSRGCRYRRAGRFGGALWCAVACAMALALGGCPDDAGAGNGAGDGSGGGVSDTTTPAAVTLTARVVSTGVKIDWTEPADADFAHVLISWTPVSVAPTQPVQVNKGTTTTTIEGLADGTYIFTAVSVDEAGNESAPSEAISVTTPPATVVLTARTIPGESPVEIRWSGVPTGSDFSHLLIRWTLADGEAADSTTTQPLQPASDATSATIEGLTVGMVYRFTVVDVDNAGNESVASATIDVTPGDVDVDDDGLIEIYTLAALNNIRHNLAGTSYDDEANDGAGNEGITIGASAAATANCKTATDSVYLCGYELMADLDFDTDGDGSSWTAASATSAPTLDENDAYYNNGAGWVPIGVNTDNNRFTAIFDGNGNTISNMAISSDTLNLGLFGATDGDDFAIRALELTAALVDYTGTADNASVGGIVGYMNGGSIVESSVSGRIEGGPGKSDNVGGLVGIQVSGSIFASSAAARVAGIGGINNSVGGLVGQQGGRIVASYVDGGGGVHGASGSTDWVGGLVGKQGPGDNIVIIASYATVPSNGTGGATNRVGGLVGLSSALIVASYATGDATGTSQGTNTVGGLVGLLDSAGSVIASYATGDVDAGSGPGNGSRAAKLIASGTEATASYGFGDNGRLTSSDGIDRSTDATESVTAVALTAENSSTTAADRWSATVWDFGDTTSQVPVLKWVTGYDATTKAFSCEPAELPSGQSCGGIIPGQVR